jgi:hypothetical protein
MSADRAASVLARLLNRSRSTGENYNLLLSRFVIQRLLFRLSVSPHAGNFVLKGALLFASRRDKPQRGMSRSRCAGHHPRRCGGSAMPRPISAASLPEGVQDTRTHNHR